MIKKYIREILLWLPINFSKNLYYDRLTRKIIRQVCGINSNCIDVGCHKGEVMDLIIKAAPAGKHFAFEPIPELAAALIKKYKNKNVQVYACALSNYNGKSAFNLVVSNPAYSGLQKRNYDRKEQDKSIDIEVKTLDTIIKAKPAIDLIKIDVEGGELDVFQGAKQLLERDHPVLIFEHGKGSAECYESGPDKMYAFLTELGYKIYSLESFISKGKNLDRDLFIKCFQEGLEYYFVAR